MHIMGGEMAALPFLRPFFGSFVIWKYSLSTDKSRDVPTEGGGSPQRSEG